MAKFNVGDRVVKITEDLIPKGATGTVMENSNNPYVNWDKKHFFVYENYLGSNVFAVFEDYLELITENNYEIY